MARGQRFLAAFFVAFFAVFFAMLIPPFVGVVKAVWPPLAYGNARPGRAGASKKKRG